jgi:hypothetical protein
MWGVVVLCKSGVLPLLLFDEGCLKMRGGKREETCVGVVQVYVLCRFVGVARLLLWRGVWEAALRTGHAAVAGGNGRVYEARAFERPRAGCRRLCVCPAEVQSCVGCATALPIGLA